MMEYMDNAKKLLLRDKHVNPIAFCYSDNERIAVPLSFNTDNQKYYAYAQLGVLCATMGSTDIIYINDAAMRQVTSEEDIERMRTDPTEQPLAYPKSMRKEVLLLSTYDFINDKSNSMVQIYRDDTGEIEWQEFLLDQQMDGNILECIIRGYRYAKEH